MSSLINFNGLEVFFTILIILTLITLLLGLVSSIIFLISNYKIFKKAKEEAWKAFIPIYNIYTGCEICGVNKKWVIIIVILMLLSSISILKFILTVAGFYFSILYSISMARSFGKSDTFAFGLLFVPIIFYPILGFGKAEYVGARPMTDPILNAFGVDDKNTTVSSSSSINKEKPKYCAGCGAPLGENDNFCGSCGRKN